MPMEKNDTLRNYGLYSGDILRLCTIVTIPDANEHASCRMRLRLQRDRGCCVWGDLFKATTRDGKWGHAVHAVNGMVLRRWSAIHTGPHVNGRWVTCEWEGSSRVKGRMQGGSRVSERSITCDWRMITRVG